MIAPTPSVLAAFRRLRLTLLAGLAVLVAFVIVTVVLTAAVESADARARQIHPCLLGDEPCNTPAPTPSPR
jgi:hypothetical protein